MEKKKVGTNIVLEEISTEALKRTKLLCLKYLMKEICGEGSDSQKKIIIIIKLKKLKKMLASKPCNLWWVFISKVLISLFTIKRIVLSVHLKEYCSWFFGDSTWSIQFTLHEQFKCRDNYKASVVDSWDFGK